MFKKLLLPLDRSPLAEQAIGQAAAIARAAHASIDIVLVHEPLPFAAFGDGFKLAKTDPTMLVATLLESAQHAGPCAPLPISPIEAAPARRPGKRAAPALARDGAKKKTPPRAAKAPGKRRSSTGRKASIASRSTPIGGRKRTGPAPSARSPRGKARR